MRFLYGILAFFFWLTIMAVAVKKYNIEIPEYVQWLSTAIVVAGAMAGGD